MYQADEQIIRKLTEVGSQFALWLAGEYSMSISIKSILFNDWFKTNDPKESADAWESYMRSVARYAQIETIAVNYLQSEGA